MFFQISSGDASIAASCFRVKPFSGCVSYFGSKRRLESRAELQLSE